MDCELSSLGYQLRFARSKFVRCLNGVSAEDAIRRLEPMNSISWIADLLEAQTVEETATVLIKTLGSETLPDPNPVDLPIRTLKKLGVRKLRLTDFAPSKRTIEQGDVDLVVGAFRGFLADALETGEDELCVVELE